MIAVIMLFQKYLTGVVIDQVATDISMVKTSLILLAVLYILEYLYQSLHPSLMNRIVEPQIMNIRKKMFHNLLYAPYSQIENIKKGELITKLMQNLDQVQQYEESIQPKMINAIVQGILAFGLCIWISPWLALISFGSIPLIIILNIFSSLPLENMVKKRNDAENSSNHYAMDIIDKLRDVKALGMEVHSFGKYKELQGDIIAKTDRLTRFRMLLTILEGMNYILPFIITFGGGAILAFRGQLMVGEFISFTYLMNPVTNLLGDLQDFLYEKSERKDAWNRVMEIYQMEIGEESKGIRKVEESIGVRLEHVSYTYEGAAEETLKDINLCIGKNEKIAIVGESGSGKSTLLKIISGLYQVSRGDIVWGNVNIACINQESFLLPLSIKENIEGKQKLFINQLEEAAEFGRINTLIQSLPEKFETVLEQKPRLSGGERQRICIARGYAQNADIIICDEPTSALDAANAQGIMENLLSLEDKTIIIVTHQLMEMDKYDKIYFLYHGEIAEAGKHEELLNYNQKYATLYHGKNGE